MNSQSIKEYLSRHPFFSGLQPEYLHLLVGGAEIGA